MERLTGRTRNFDGTGFALESLTSDGRANLSNFVDKVLTRLADYEDAEEQGLLTKVVYGEWIDTEPDYHNGYYRNAHQCSNCQDYYTTEYNEMNYCPNCGAKMKTKEEAEQKLASMQKGE